MRCNPFVPASPTLFSVLSLASVLGAGVVLTACGGKADPADEGGSDGSDGASDGGADGGDGADGGADGGDPVEPGTPIAGQPNGTFLVTMSLDPVGGLQLPFQAEVATVTLEDGSSRVSLALRASKDNGDTLSDLLGTAYAPLQPDGTWITEPTSFVLPAAFAPTGSDVEVAPVFSGITTSETSFCGEISGSIVTFDIDLAGSTFGGVPWEDRLDGAVASCDGPSEGYTPIAACPTLSVGLNTGFPSAGEDRSFELVLPEAYDPAAVYPLVVAYHGLGGDIASMLDGAELRGYADDRGIILAVPQGLDFGGSPGFDAINADPYNKDIQLFDDMFGCIRDQYAVDSERVYVTGMSNGGLMSGAIFARRSELLAAAAPFSGGVITEWPETAANLPLLVSWGGVDDVAFDQDFNRLSTELIDEALGRGHFVVSCDHGLGHELRADFWPWAMDFLLGHSLSGGELPFADGLTDAFPSYCAVVD